MAILGAILGILMVILGFSLMFTPLATFLATGYFVGIIFLVYGIYGIIRAFQKKAKVLDILVSILALVVGIISLIRPGSTLVFDGIMIFVIAAWFLILGIVSIVQSIRARHVEKAWWCRLIAGICSIILGIICAVNPLLTAVAGGIMIGLFFIVTGFNLITAGFFGSGGSGTAEA